jgi:hypothetical protein
MSHALCTAKRGYDPAMDPEIAEQFEKRDRFLRHLRLSQTPAERMDAFHALQNRAWEVLRGNPQAYAEFLRRNFEKRSIANNGGHAHW